MTKRFRWWLEHGFRSYLDWDTDLQEEARERVVNEYVRRIHAGSTDQILNDLRWEIEEDLQQFLEGEHYEVCQLLKDIQEEIE